MDSERENKRKKLLDCSNVLCQEDNRKRKVILGIISSKCIVFEWFKAIARLNRI